MDSCGPVNPLQQLSKTFNQDNSTQRDHFNPHASSSSSSQSFRQPHPNQQQQNKEASNFYQHQLPTLSQPPTAFDFSQVRRELPAPSIQGPAWATSFSQQMVQQPTPMTLGGGGSAWSGDFMMRNQSPALPLPLSQQHQVQREREDVEMMSGSSRMGGGRFGGQGFIGPMMGGGMMSPMSLGAMGGVGVIEPFHHQQQHQQRQQDTHTQSAWETAFLEQESSTLSMNQRSSDSFTSATITELPDEILSSSILNETSSQTAQDDLARTAGALLETLSQRQGQTPAGSTVADKFGKSTFVELMMKLRDGQVVVEGDKVVEQIGPAISSGGGVGLLDKGKGKEREEEGRMGSSYPIMRSGGEDLGSFATRQHEFAEREATLSQMAREAQKNYDELNGIWEDEDAVRSAREREGRGISKNGGRGYFQGDGGMIASDDEDMDDGLEDGSFLLGPEKSKEDMRFDTTVPLASHYWEEEGFIQPTPSTSFSRPTSYGQQKIDVTGAMDASYWDDDDQFSADLISGGHAMLNVPASSVGGKGKERELSEQQKEWAALQDDWDSYDATSTGFTSTHSIPSTSTSTSNFPQAHSLNPSYDFVSQNPYLSTTPVPQLAQTHTHALHSTYHTHQQPQTTFDSLLQHEAAVLRSPHSPQAWLNLGIKQQENERESLAISALTQALKLDSGLAEAYLALAVSYTNENERSKAYESIWGWVKSFDKVTSPSYSATIESYLALNGNTLPVVGTGNGDRHRWLTGLLIELVRSKGGEVDPDVQIALGVLFNTSEEYEKASDCFGAALGVRPDDPLLFNRLGATLANSGKTETSIQYYVEALELHPAYVRARFNLAVAHMNLGQYEQAVEQLMTSLSIQEADVDLIDAEGPNNAGSGVTSQTLWDSLNVALMMMQRSDLAAFTTNKDLTSLKAQFMPAE